LEVSTQKRSFTRASANQRWTAFVKQLGPVGFYLFVDDQTIEKILAEGFDTAINVSPVACIQTEQRESYFLNSVPLPHRKKFVTLVNNVGPLVGPLGPLRELFL